MSHDVLQGQWRQLRGQARDWWGKLTDDDLDRIEGNWDKLVGALQSRYGYSKTEAEAQVNRHLTEYNKQHPMRPTTPPERGHHDRPM